MTTALYDSLKNDYLYFDNVETFTLTPVSGSAVTTAKGIREPIGQRMLSSAGQRMLMEIGILDDGAMFVLFDTTLGGLIPQYKFKLTDPAGAEWNIAEAQPLTARTRWMCLCTKYKANT